MDRLGQYEGVLGFLDEVTSSDRTIDLYNDRTIDLYNDRTILSALKILHNLSLQGRLRNHREKIIILNQHLTNSYAFAERLHISEDTIKNVQIAVPKTKFEDICDIPVRFACFYIAFIKEMFAGIFFVILTIGDLCKRLELDGPEGDDVIKEKPAILLLHGSHSNLSGWVIGKRYLQKEGYGSVFSLNYDPLFKNHKKGIDDYAQGIVADAIEEIKERTGCREVILIGHSMGGCISTYYAENLAKQKKTVVNNVITIGSPLMGTMVADTALKIAPCIYDTKRIRQFSKEGGNFREPLAQKARGSDGQKRDYYSVYSIPDLLVPGDGGCLTLDPRRQMEIADDGHCSLIFDRRVWRRIVHWLDDIYTISD